MALPAPKSLSQSIRKFIQNKMFFQIDIFIERPCATGSKDEICVYVRLLHCVFRLVNMICSLDASLIVAKLK